jgi:hypothetical protein
MNKVKRQLQEGLSKITVLVFLPLLVLSIYCSYHIIPFYYDYYELQNQMDSLVRVSSMNTDQEIRDKLAAHLKRTNLPVTIEDFKFERYGESMRISVSYDEIFFISFQGEDIELYTFHFDAIAEGS